jgi:hypothetical protein
VEVENEEKNKKKKGYSMGLNRSKHLGLEVHLWIYGEAW